MVQFQRVLVNGVPATDLAQNLSAGDVVIMAPPPAPAAPARPPDLKPPAIAGARRAPRERRTRNRADASAAGGGPARSAAPRARGGAAADRQDSSLPRGIRIVYQDADIIVIDKPPGIVTASPTPTREPTVFDILKEYARRRGAGRTPRGGPRSRPLARPPRPFVIHRLDKEASGLLVFAKTERAFGVLKEELRAKRIHRLYVALVEGTLGEPGTAGTIQSFLLEDNTGRVSSIDSAAFRGPPPRPAPGAGPRGTRPVREGAQATARLAVTHYRVLAAANNLTLAQVRLETGRKNQVRVHFAERGHPLAGDRRHGATTDPVGRLGLHAAELGFAHPSTGQALRFTSPAPVAFYRAVGLVPPAAAGGEELAPAASAPAPAFPSVAASRPPTVATSWDAVADWYDHLLGEEGSDHYENVILPGTLRLLRPAPGMRVLDVACGQGILARRLADLGVLVTGVEASDRLVEAARRRTAAALAGRTATPEAPTYLVADARNLSPLGLHDFDAAACVMALGNIDPVEPVLRGVADALKPGGAMVFVISHPAFRAPRQTSWGWDAKAHTQYRRVEGYLSPGQVPIDMHPGRKARGEEGGEAVTISFHRPLQDYSRALAQAGFWIESLEEWPGARLSTSGPRADEENRARREIPLFLAVRAVKR